MIFYLCCPGLTFSTTIVAFEHTNYDFGPHFRLNCRPLPSGWAINRCCCSTAVQDDPLDDPLATVARGIHRDLAECYQQQADASSSTSQVNLPAGETSLLVEANQPAARVEVTLQVIGRMPGHARVWTVAQSRRTSVIEARHGSPS